MSQQFTAAVTNAGNTAVTWAANPAVGSITGSGLYTAPASVAAQQEITLTATSVADSTKSATARVTVLPTASWYNTAWGYRKPVAFDHTKVTATLAGFPALIAVTDPDLRSTANGGKVGNGRGSDIVFTSGDGVTPLNYEIEFYSPATDN